MNTVVSERHLLGLQQCRKTSKYVSMLLETTCRLQTRQSLMTGKFCNTYTGGILQQFTNKPLPGESGRSVAECVIV